jgi:DNA polymerase I-like protein with 3'-5' exonuclease and polymerase domains
MAIDTRNETGPMTWVLDEEGLSWLGEQLLGASEIVVDLETTGLDEHAVEGGTHNGGVGARIALASFTLPQAVMGSFGDRRWNGETPVTWILPLSHPDSPWRGKWKRVLRDLLTPTIKARIPYVNQNIKFDSRWMFATCNIDISSLIMWDTKDGAFLQDENESTKLKVAVPKKYGIPAWNDFDLSTPGAAERVPLLDLGAYAGRDTWWTWVWARDQRIEFFLGDVEEEPFDAEDRQMANLGKLSTWVVMPTVASLTKVEQRGMRLDIDWTREQLRINEAISKEGLDEMAETAEMDRASASTAPTSHWFRDFTNKMVEQDRLRVMATTNTGLPQWNKTVLFRQVRAGSEMAELVLKQRQATKKAEFLRSWLELVSPKGIIHANFNSGSVRTGRLSSSNPNLQQVTKSLRPAFIPRDGFVIADFDYSQIELRVGAFVSRSETMMQAFKDGADLHRRFAALINNVTEDLVEGGQRQQAKAGNFGLLYEMSAYGFKIYAETAYGVLLTEEEAAKIHAAFFTMWTGIKQWHEDSKNKARRDGFIVSPLGRVRRVPNIWDQNQKLSGMAERQAINSPVQSMASDLLQMAMASMQGLLPEAVHMPEIAGVYPVATVHDSIVAELEEDNWESQAREVAERMTSLGEVLAKFGVDFDVPLEADYSVGTRWSLSDVSNPEVPVLQTSPVDVLDYEELL